MNTSIKIKQTTPIVLYVICVIIGAVLLYMGITGTDSRSERTEHYLTTDGYFVDCELYSESEYDHIKNRHTSATYLLIYSYVVDGCEYRITTDYATSIIPKENSTRQIQYNPEDPAEAVIAGAGKLSGLILIGLMFVVIPVIICVGRLYLSGMIRKGFRLFEFGLGAVLAFFGYGAVYAMSDGFSIVKAFQAAGFISVIPTVLIAAGVFQMIKCLLPCKKNTEEE